MRVQKRNLLTLFTLLFLSWGGRALAATDLVQLKSGKMGLNSFLEMVSDKLKIQIDASGLGGSNDTVSVPEVGLVSTERAKAMVLTSLYLQGYTWIHSTAYDLYRVLPLRDARDQEIPLLTDSDPLPDSDLLVTYIIPIQHTRTEYIARNLRSFMPGDSRIIPHESMGAVLVTDSAHNISKLKELVQHLDTPQAAKLAKEELAEIAKRVDAPCPSFPGGNSQLPQSGILIGLFSLIALMIGFLARGYVIRRIEGGL